jgi:hypothetical protein
MKFNCADYTVKELLEIKNKINNAILLYKDGYEYICHVRSYGRNWNEYYKNDYAVQELCYSYNGDDGIVDVYSTNPDLYHLENYGVVKYIRSVEEYKKWYDYEYVKSFVRELEEEWQAWEESAGLPYLKRPMQPLHSKKDLELYKKELAEYDTTSFVPPADYKQPYDERETTNDTES